MKKLAVPQSRAEQTYQILLDEICDGSMPVGTPLIQENLAAQLGVSRQPIQQALARLKGDGLLEEAPGRGLCIPPLDLSKMRAHYEIRGSLDRLAAQLAAQRVAEVSLNKSAVKTTGQKILDAGGKAVASGSVKNMIKRDVEFHLYLYELSGNPLITPAAETHWRFLRRVMGDVLRHAEPPVAIWQQHDEILQAIVSGNADLAASLAGTHIDIAREALMTELMQKDRLAAQAQ